MDLSDEESGQNLHRIVLMNPRLNELNITTRGRHVLRHLDHLACLRIVPSTALVLSLLECMQDSRGLLVAQVAIGGGQNRNSTEGSELSPIHGSPPCDLAGTCLQWECDHFFAPQSDFSASFLDIACRHYPSVLTMLTLDASQLSPFGLKSVQNILSRSNLEHLEIVCTVFHADISDAIVSVLGSIQWPTLKSLVLSGDNIDQWIQLWPSAIEPWLLSFSIHGIGSVRQSLSHSSFLFVHRIVQASSLVALCLGNIQMQDKHDWALFVDGVDPSIVKIV